MKQPEALRSLYEITNNIADYNTVLVNLGELRRLNEVNQELLAALKEAEPMLSSMLEHIKAHLGDNYKMPALGRVRAAIANAKEQS